MNLSDRLRSSAVPLLVGVLIGGVGVVLATGRVPALAGGPPLAPPALKAEMPTARGLDATLWMQTAAEYRACCLQAYNLGLVRLKERLAKKGGPGKNPAVVLDLDETVFDNGGQQAMMLRSGLGYDPRLWDLREKDHARDVGLVPGAKEFLLAADKLGVGIYYISNRNDDRKFRPSTIAALKNLGLPFQGEDHLLLETRETGGNKTSRRRTVEKAATVLLYFGDNLRDFDEQFKCGVDNTRDPKNDPDTLANAIKERKDRVDATRTRWGGDWIILPNPEYGEWTKPLGLGRKDYDRLVAVAPAE